MIRRFDRASARRRRSLLLVLLLLVSSLGARALHWLATPHRMCEIHGTLEHDVAAAPDSAPETPTGPVYRPEGRSHEECSLGPCLRGEALPLQETRLVASFPHSESAALLPDAPPPEQARYRLAPSRSPPV